MFFFFFFQAEDGIRDKLVTGVQTCALPISFLLRLAVITIGHTYRITPRRDHFQFGWEMGRLARSIAQGQGFSSPTDLPSGPSAWTAPVYPYILAGVFKVFGVYTSA